MSINSILILSSIIILILIFIPSSILIPIFLYANIYLIRTEILNNYWSTTIKETLHLDYIINIHF